MYVCSCFGITEQQVAQHAAEGRCTPRRIASACKAGTDCGSCVKRIQALLGRGGGCVTRTRLEPVHAAEPAPGTEHVPTPIPEPAPAVSPAPSVRPPLLPVAPLPARPRRAA